MTDIVAALIELFDGSATQAAVIRRTVLQVTADLPPDHPARDVLDEFYSDLQIYGLSLNVAHGDMPAARQLLLESWAAVVKTISSS